MRMAQSPAAEEFENETRTKQATVDCYREWIARHDGRRPPTREEDIAHMKGLFPRLTEGRIRDLRRRLAPSSWTARRRRKRPTE